MYRRGLELDCEQIYGICELRVAELVFEELYIHAHCCDQDARWLAGVMSPIRKGIVCCYTPEMGDLRRLNCD